MGNFTEKYNAWQSGEIEELDADIIEELLTENVLPAIRSALGPRIGAWSVFGADDHDDITNRAAVKILQSLQDRDECSKFFNTETLIKHMCDWARNYRNKQRKSLKGEKRSGKEQRGISGLGRNSDAECRDHDMIPTTSARTSVSVAWGSELSEEMNDLLRAAIDDLTEWFGKDSQHMQIFTDIMQTSSTQRDIASKHNVPATTVSRIRKASEYCFLRRTGCGPRVLNIERFPKMEQWESELLAIEARRNLN